MSDDEINIRGNQEEIEEPSPPPFGDDLRIDTEDEENLEKLPEIERELILSERHDFLQRYKESKAIYDKYMYRKAPQRESRTSKNLKSKGRKESYDSASIDSYSSSESPSSSYSSTSRSDDEEEAVRNLAGVSTEQGIAESLAGSLTPELATSIQATRDLLMSSFQDVPVELRDEALTDLFVKIPSNTDAHIICRIIRAIERSSKSDESGKFDLEVELPSNESTTVKVSSISNSPITAEELTAWIAQYSDQTARDQARTALRKQAQVKQVKAFVWDDRTINRILAQRNRSTVKLTLEIAKLRTQLQAELGALNNSSLSDEQRNTVQENINKLNKDIAQLESDYRSAQRAFSEANAHQFGIVAINYRNRTEQRLQDVEEARKRLKSSKGKTGELDPFKRRECKPVVMWDVGKRSPKKEPSANPTGHKLEEEMLTDGDSSSKRKTLTDFISIEKLMDNVEKAMSEPGARLSAVRRKISKSYSKSFSPIWDNQLIGGQVGEIMEFAEWKRRVAEEDVEMQE
jgi:hypothetical protein